MPSGSDEFPVLVSRLTPFEVKTGVGLQKASDEWGGGSDDRLAAT